MFNLLGGSVFVLDVVTVIFERFNAGMGGAVLLAAVALCLHFGRRRHQPTYKPATASQQPIAV
ncbi:MAG TPA: hypothetical protein VGD69_26365 [Herpetosiphonaceae bacterium]